MENMKQNCHFVGHRDVWPLIWTIVCKNTLHEPQTPSSGFLLVSGYTLMFYSAYVGHSQRTWPGNATVANGYKLTMTNPTTSLGCGLAVFLCDRTIVNSRIVRTIGIRDNAGGTSHMATLWRDLCPVNTTGVTGPAEK